MRVPWGLALCASGNLQIKDLRLVVPCSFAAAVNHTVFQALATCFHRSDYIYTCMHACMCAVLLAL